MTTQEQSFEDAVAEFLEKSREELEKESGENRPPWAPSPFEQSGPPYEYSQRFTPDLVTKYALTIGDDNPLFTDPDHAGRYSYSARYLGPHLHWAGSCRQELVRRVESAKQAFYAYAQLFFSDCVLSFKRTVFQGVILATMYSALPALPLDI